MRSIFDIGNKLLETITNEDLKLEINSVLSSSKFRAPELMYVSWNDLHDILVEGYESPFTSSEAMSVFVIFTGKSESELNKFK